MIETAVVVDDQGKTLFWHLPPGRSATYIPDSRSLWEVMWENKDRLGGVAHTHPGHGTPDPSWEDVTTWSACERGLGRRLVWPILTFDQEAYFEWSGPGKYDYTPIEDPPFRVEERWELVDKSKGGAL